MDTRPLSFVDQLITGFDRALRSLTPNTQVSGRANPAEQRTENELSDSERRHAAGLMRVNHAGEVCAQALYQGQALTAKLTEVRQEMEFAADEEIDHLAWCEDRLKELNSHTSLLNPAWYLMSFSIGATAGLISDRISLGFVAATEEQVCKHLRHHLEVLPEQDMRSRAIVEQMLEDEERHGHAALEAGGREFSGATKAAMTLISKAMTLTSYRI
jgi:ubiquinone biosynthesis monooxygenase Coq7